VDSNPTAMLAFIHGINSQLASLRAALEQGRASLWREGRPAVVPAEPPPLPPVLQPTVANAVAALRAGKQSKVCFPCMLQAIAYDWFYWAQSL